jgi:uncharacterized MAPEG superfamily protein
MTTPLWVLLGFAGWTLLLLTVTIGVFRWSHILTGRDALADFRADKPHGDFYRRAMRAHANCIENLPIYTAIVVVASVLRVRGPALDALAVALLCARVAQSIVHVAFVETNRTVAVRFGFYSVQIACMVAMGVLVVSAAG